MRFFRLWLSGVSACCLAFSLPFVSYASVATSSEAVPVASGSNARPATPSEPLPMDPDVEADDFDTIPWPSTPSQVPAASPSVPLPPASDGGDPPGLMSDGEDVVKQEGSVSDYSRIYVDFHYYDNTNTLRTYRRYCDSNGYFSISDLNVSKNHVIGFHIKSRDLPPSGTYLVTLKFTSNTGGFQYNGERTGVYVYRDIHNAEPTGNGMNASFSQVSGDFTASAIVDLSNVNHLYFNVVPDQHLQLPYGGYISFKFSPTNSSGALTNPDVGNISNDVNGDLVNGIEQQVEQGDTIIELIKNTIQTISSQLTAFWNQLAGEFTNLYNKMTAEHAEDLAKVDEQIEADRQNTDDIIANQDQNTNTITNGYDSSALDQSSNALNDKLTEYDKIESGIHDSASSWISDFTLPDFDNLIDSGGILAACVWLGSFWQDLFTQMGAFNIPVTLSLSLVFVLMLVGYHRFRR